MISSLVSQLLRMRFPTWCPHRRPQRDPDLGQRRQTWRVTHHGSPERVLTPRGTVRLLRPRGGEAGCPRLRILAARAGWFRETAMRTAVLRVGRGIRWYLKQATGEAKWDEYLDRCRWGSSHLAPGPRTAPGRAQGEPRSPGAADRPVKRLVQRRGGWKRDSVRHLRTTLVVQGQFDLRGGASAYGDRGEADPIWLGADRDASHYLQC